MQILFVAPCFICLCAHVASCNGVCISCHEIDTLVVFFCVCIRSSSNTLNLYVKIATWLLAGEQTPWQRYWSLDGWLFINDYEHWSAPDKLISWHCHGDDTSTIHSTGAEDQVTRMSARNTQRLTIFYCSTVECQSVVTTVFYRCWILMTWKWTRRRQLV